MLTEKLTRQNIFTCTFSVKLAIGLTDIQYFVLKGESIYCEKVHLKQKYCFLS